LLFVLCCFPGCQEQDAALERIRAAGALRVGLDPSWPPFEFVDPTTGQVAGLDVDLARAVAARLGVEAQFVICGWEGLYDALRTGQFDAAISALSYEGWRTQAVAYSISYFDAGPVMVVPADETAVRKPQDLNKRTVYLEFGSEGDIQARRLQKRGIKLTAVAHETAPAALMALADKPENSAAIVDAVSARLFIREHPQFRIVGESLYDESYAIAVDINAQSLRKAIDQALIEMRESGELEALLNRWL